MVPLLAPLFLAKSGPLLRPEAKKNKPLSMQKHLSFFLPLIERILLKRKNVATFLSTTNYVQLLYTGCSFFVLFRGIILISTNSKSELISSHQSILYEETN